MSKIHTPVVTGDRFKVLVAICISAVIIPLVFTGPAISTLAVGRDLGGDQSTLSWIVNAYAIAFGGCVMAAGAIGDQIGRRRCFVAGLWIFIATSLLIGLTPNLLLLNLLRAAEGVGGALVLTSATSLLAQEFEGTERTRAFSFLGTAFGVGLAFGPMASGFLIEHLGWRSLYFAIALIAALILLLGTKRIKESLDPDAQGIDWPGTVSFTTALVLLTFGIVYGPQDGWASLKVLSMLGGAVLLLGIFVAVELRRSRPMLELSLFRYPRFIGVQLLPVATGFSFIALIVYVPIWFIVIQGRDAFTAGLAILPLTAPMLVIPLLAGRMAQYLSPGLLSGIGFLISALGTWLLMDLSPDGSLWAMAIPMLLIGVGNGLPWGLMDALSVSVVPKTRAGMAAGIFTTMRVAGEAIAIAVIGATLVGLTAVNLRAAADANSLALPQHATMIASQIGTRTGHGSSASATDDVVIELAHHAYTSAFHSIFSVLALLSVLTAAICILTLRKSSDVPDEISGATDGKQ
ncbi:MFS transporter [Pectobacterium punjabense]|uniref:MFS transporter n=1 Tax=Pectobacterium punjabense TaxID=2108399 RepID=UPI002B24D76F|nr:MFS transporter [Pectobacterium punjabense]